MTIISPILSILTIACACYITCSLQLPATPGQQGKDNNHHYINTSHTSSTPQESKYDAAWSQPAHCGTREPEARKDVEQTDEQYKKLVYAQPGAAEGVTNALYGASDDTVRI